jgi:hypothetical protein
VNKHEKLVKRNQTIKERAIKLPIVKKENEYQKKPDIPLKKVKTCFFSVNKNLVNRGNRKSH